MPKTGFKFTNRAVDDITSIWNYTFDKWSRKQADKYYKEIIQECNKIAKSPTLGRNYSDVIHTLRGSRINRHIIFYRTVSENEVKIERILHERMDPKKHLGE